MATKFGKQIVPNIQHAGEWVKVVTFNHAHNRPYQAAYLVGNTVVLTLLGPGGLVALPLKLAGFSSSGPIAGIWNIHSYHVRLADKV